MTGAMHQIWVYTNQWAWIEDRAKLVGISASALMRALIDTAMNIDTNTNNEQNHNNHTRKKRENLYRKITKPQMAWEGAQNNNPNRSRGNNDD